ncbi:MAG: hypothetical protein M3540_11480 [Actinomycetota bacterium]|nr:hypothetical protein [Actinomycetota bacterium]
MRLAATLFRPSRSYAAGSGRGGDAPRGEAGSAADSYLADLMVGGPDVNPELTGTAKFEVYDEMRKTDPSVKSLLMYQKLPIRAAKWGLEPKKPDTMSEPDPFAKAICDAACWQFGLEGNLGELDMSWDELTAQGLTMLDFGLCLEELVWADDLKAWRDADGDEHRLRPIDRVAIRPPMTVQTVKMEKGRIKWVEQNIAGTDRIPGGFDARKLSHMRYEREGDRWDGVSLLRPTWGAWRLKKFLTVTSGIAFDRFAMGVPVVWHPDTAEGEQRAKSIGRNLRGSHERAYVHFPIPQGGSKADAEYGLEILNAAGSIADPTPLLRWCAEQISEAGMQQFKDLGRTDSGSRATAQVQVDPYFLGVESLANYLKRERSRQLLRQFVEVNFGVEAAQTRMPVLTVTKIQARSVDAISRAISYLDQAGLHFTDRGAYNDIRELLGFEPLSEEEYDLRFGTAGLTRAQVTAAVQAAGLDPEQMAAVVASLPADVGIAANRVEGNGLPAAA